MCPLGLLQGLDLAGHYAVPQQALPYLGLPILDSEALLSWQHLLPYPVAAAATISTPPPSGLAMAPQQEGLLEEAISQVSLEGIWAK